MFFILLFIFLLVAVIMLWNSKLQVEIYNLDISTARTEKVKKDFEIYISIIIFNKLQILRVNAKKIKSKNINLGMIIEKTKEFREKTNKTEQLRELINSLEHFKIEVKKADLKAEIGTQDAAITAILVGIVGSVLGIILKKQKFQVLPLYQNINILNLKLDCIIRINLIHYIYKTITKGSKKYERKSSDRGAYAYSNE